jgi:hypothetical protein
VPLLWCGISGATLLSMEAPEGWIPIAAAVLAFSAAMRQTLANRRRKTAVPATS